MLPDPCALDRGRLLGDFVERDQGVKDWACNVPYALSTQSTRAILQNAASSSAV